MRLRSQWVIDSILQPKTLQCIKRYFILPFFRLRHCVPSFASEETCRSYHDHYKGKFTDLLGLREKTTEALEAFTKDNAANSTTLVARVTRSSPKQTAKTDDLWYLPASSSGLFSGGHRVGLFQIGGESTSSTTSSSSSTSQVLKLKTYGVQGNVSANALNSVTWTEGKSVGVAAGKPVRSLMKRQTRKWEQLERSLRNTLRGLKTDSALLRRRLEEMEADAIWQVGLGDQLGRDLETCLNLVAKKESEKNKIQQMLALEQKESKVVHIPERKSKSFYKIIMASIGTIFWIAISFMGVMACRFHYMRARHYDLLAH